MSAGNGAAETGSSTPNSVSGRTLAWSDPRLLTAVALLVPVAVMAVLQARQLGWPADLLAVWVAGEFWQMGRVDAIYPAADGLFTMLTPEGWTAWLADTQGYHDFVYPFLYPPLWAVVMGTLAPSDFTPIAAASYWVNAGLLVATVVLAIRATGALLHPVLHAAFVLVIFLTTEIASVGFLQGQPHIFVAFLLVLAVERSRAGAGATAGGALALAASIKLFPVIYVVIWLARGEKRALVSFAVVGGALALASVVLAGWPLHAAFLHNVRQMGQTLLVIGNTMSFDAVIGKLILSDTLQVVHGPSIGSLGGAHTFWHVAERPALWAACASAGLVLVLAGSAYAARRMPVAALHAGLWPCLLTLSVLFTPTGWIYYMLPAAVFAPVLLAALPRPRGAAFFLGGLLLFFSARLDLFKASGSFVVDEVFLYVAGALVWGIGFALAARNLSDE